MASAEVIQEFLVSLGFKLDETQTRRFADALGSNQKGADALDKTLQGLEAQLGILGQRLQDLADKPRRSFEDTSDRIRRRSEFLTRDVKQLGLTVISTAGAFATGFSEIARQYQNLYYVQQRTGVSGGALAGMGFAGSQIGVGKDAMVQATEALATAARNPGMAAMLKGWSVMAENGRLADDAVMRFVAHVRTMPPYLQDAYANMFGVPVELMRNMINNFSTLQQANEDWQRRINASGVDYDKFIKDANQITRDLTTVWSQLGIVGVQGFELVYDRAHQLLGTFSELVDKTIEWNKTHPGAVLAENIAASAASALGLLGILGKITGLPLMRYGIVGSVLWGTGSGAMSAGNRILNPETAAAREDKALKGSWSPKWLDPAYDLGKLLRAMGWVSGEDKPHFAEGGIVPVNAHAGEIFLPQGLSSLLLSVATGQGSSGPLGGFAEHFREWLSGSTTYVPTVRVLGIDPNSFSGGSPTGDTAPFSWGVKTPGWRGSGGNGGGGGSSGSGGMPAVPATITDRTRGAYDYFVKQGWSGPQAAGIVGALQGVESNLNPKARGDSGLAFGIGQWHPDRQANFNKVFGKDIRSSSFEEQLAFIQWELTHTEAAAGSRLKQESGAYGSGFAFESFFERPRDRARAGAMAGNFANKIFGALGLSSGGSGGLTAALGDSIAYGVAQAGRLAETMSQNAGDRNNARFAAVWGRSPAQVLDVLGHMDLSAFRGKHVALSSGASNDPNQTGLAAQQIELLKKAGVDVSLLGVGSGVANYRNVNARLAEIAKAANVAFSGELATTEGGRFHPRDYGAVLRQLTSRTLGGGEQNVTVNHDAGDRTVHQTNNVTINGGSMPGHQHVIGALNREAGRWFRNADAGTK